MEMFSTAKKELPVEVENDDDDVSVFKENAEKQNISDDIIFRDPLKVIFK